MPSTPAPAPACRRSRRGCRRRPAPACRGDRSCCARPGSRCRCTAPASSPGCRCSRRASRAPRAGRARSWSTCSSTAAPTACRSSPRPATPTTAACAPTSRCPTAPTSSARTARLTWHPSATPLARLHAEGKVSVLPAVGYDHPDQSHFVSRHFWEVGATDAGLRSGLARPAARRHRDRRQPAPGRVDGRQPRAVARHHARAGRGGRRAGGVRLLDARRVGPARRPRADRVRRRRPRPPGVARPGGRAGGPRGRVRRQRAHVARPARQGRQTRLHAARHLPAERGAVPEAARRARRDARCRPADPLRHAHRARRLGHARRPGQGAPGEPQDRRRQPVRVPARPRGARAGRPRAHARVVGVRPPRGRERLGHRPRRGRDRLRDRHAGDRPDDRRVPGPGHARPAGQPARHVRLPRPVRGTVRGLVRGRPRLRCSPAAARWRGRRSCGESRSSFSPRP